MGKSNAQDTKGTATAAQGLPEVQASKAQANLTVSPTDIQPIQLKPTSKFVHPRYPDQVMSGDQLWQLANRGTGYDKLQSEAAKLRERNTFLEQQVNQITTVQEERDIDARINQRLREMIPQRTPVSQDADDGLSQWVTGDDDNGTPAQEFNPDKIVAGLSVLNAEKEQRILANIDKLVDERINTLFNQRAEQEQRGKQQSTWLQRTKDAEIRSLKTQYPDIPDDIINEVIELEDSAAYDQLKALAIAEQGNDAGAMDTHFDAKEKRQKAMQLRIQMDAKQRLATTKAQANAELEGLSMGVIPGEDVGETPPEHNRFKHEDTSKHRESIVDRAKKLVGMIDASSSAYPE